MSALLRMRLADAYDAAQESGEVATGNRAHDFGVGGGNAKPTAADLGIRRDEIHQARKMRDVLPQTLPRNPKEETPLAGRSYKLLISLRDLAPAGGIEPTTN